MEMARASAPRKSTHDPLGIMICFSMTTIMCGPPWRMTHTVHTYSSRARRAVSNVEIEKSIV